MGVMSPIGCTLQAFWSALLEGRSGIVDLELLGIEGHPLQGGRVASLVERIEDFPPVPDVVRRRLRRSLKTMNRETRLGVAAVEQALADGQVELEQYDPLRVGVCFGVGHVGLDAEEFRRGIDACRTHDGGLELAYWGEKGLPKVNPLWILTCMPNLSACSVAMLRGLQGPSNSITLDAAAMSLAVSEAVSAIEEDEADVMIVGGCGNYLNPCSLLHAAVQTELARPAADPQRILRPFDVHRSGTVPAEAAAALVLEDMESAIDRGARIYGEIVATGSSCVVRVDGTPDRSSSIANALRVALSAAGCDLLALGHVHAHGLSSRCMDQEEAAAIRAVLGSGADRIPVTAAKGHCGYAGAGSTALELVASFLALQHGILFPILNCEYPDASCPISPATEVRPLEGDCFLQVGVTSQGQASAVIGRKAA